MKQKIEKSQYIHTILAYQKAFNEEDLVIEFNRMGLDYKNHSYKATRFKKSNKWCFSLSQDGIDVYYPFGTIDSIDQIINELARLYSVIKLTPQEYRDWEVYFRELARTEKSLSSQIEFLAAWFETLQRIGLLSAIDVRKIAAQKFPEENMKKFNERILGEEIKNKAVIALKIQTPILQRKIKTLLLAPEASHFLNETLNTELEEFCRSYISKIFKEKFETRLPQKKIVKSPIYNEPAFRINLEYYYKKILNNIPERMIPM